MKDLNLQGIKNPDSVVLSGSLEFCLEILYNSSVKIEIFSTIYFNLNKASIGSITG